jgi:hypothetical protein
MFELVCSQMKYIANAQHKILIENTLKNMTAASLTAEDTLSTPDAGDILWGTDQDGPGEFDERTRGRSVSPATQRRDRDMRKMAHSVGSKRISDDDSERKPRSSSLQSRTGSRNTAVAPKDGNNNSLRQTESPKTVGDGDSVGSNIEGADSQSSLVLRTIPVEVAFHAAVCRGCFLGVRLWQHPLQTQPSYVQDVRQSIADSTLSDNKKFEWELDLMRELDEKKMEKYEAYLCGSRIVQGDASLASSSKYWQGSKLPRKKLPAEDAGISRVSQTSYYKDRGRFPTRGPL